MNMSLASLLHNDSLPQIVLSGLTEDSRQVQAGDAFVATRGEHSDGHVYAAQAVQSGAVAVLCEQDLKGLSVPAIKVIRLRERRSEIAARFFADPSRSLFCIGVTGTNGKTSVAHEVADLASRLGAACGFIGTIGWGVPDDLKASVLTTEGPLVIQQRLADLRDRNCSWVAMETSSHALDQYRVEAVAFDVAVFTNLTRDHLDYHQNMAAYGAAKRRLFLFESLKHAIVNIGDPFGADLNAELRTAGRLQVISYGTDAADVHWQAVSRHDQGFSAELVTPWGRQRVEVSLVGMFSLTNLAAAVAVLCVGGMRFADVASHLHQVRCVPGRMEFYHAPGKPAVVVDFAHTPDALGAVLKTLRGHCKGRLICLIGCGGDRDTGKRPLMARVAEQEADQVILTSDNPRSEDPQAIINDMLRGMQHPETVLCNPDRAQAALIAMETAKPDDLVLLAGKGHEEYQEVSGKRFHYSDREMAHVFMGHASSKGDT
ncbi:MAG: UDP-N-acetylmuramoyl-L-alanyl-D-glutamate--2,6-diaminopimelate ligase [Proteobacteria bacterium]|nr:UDP-N-acetylmuramoyl-L-alanyl-D-glutamate--2,6-diaminopimelate ligase [Pseudomonadota bacterium]